MNALGIRSKEGVALRATFIVDPDNVIQHVSVNGLSVGRNPGDTLRVLMVSKQMSYVPATAPLVVRRSKGRTQGAGLCLILPLSTSQRDTSQGDI